MRPITKVQENEKTTQDPDLDEIDESSVSHYNLTDTSSTAKQVNVNNSRQIDTYVEIPSGVAVDPSVASFIEKLTSSKGIQPVFTAASGTAEHVTILNPLQARIGVKILPPEQTAVKQPKDPLLTPETYTIANKLRQYYARRLENDSDLVQALKWYVPAECVANPTITEANARHNLHNVIIMPFIYNQSSTIPPLLLLQGETGSGKSLYVHWLEQLLWNSLRGAANPIPIFIELKYIKFQKNKEGNPIEDHLRSLGYTDSEILKLKNDFSTVIILDGFDEMPGSPFNLYQILRLNTWRARVIITCRTQYLNNHSDYADWFVYKPGASLQEWYLAPFHQKHIDIFVAEYSKDITPPVEWRGKTHSDKLKELTNDYTLLSNPLLLYMVLKALPTLVKKRGNANPNNSPEILIRADIYAAFFQEWFDRETQRLKLLKGEDALLYQDLPPREAFMAFCEDLALQMFLTKPDESLTTVNYHPPKPSRANRYSKAVVSSSSDVWEKFLSDTNPMVVQTRTGCPLRCFQKIYSFFHRSFFEYFIATALSNDIGLELEDDSPFQSALAALRDTYWNRKHLKHEPAVIGFLAEMIQYQPRKLERLFAMVIASHENPEVGIAASNAISALVRAKYSVSFRNLSGLNLPDALLDEIIADHTNFNDTNLSNASLLQAWLRGANLRGCQLSGIQFGERPYLEFNSNVKCISTSHDGKLLAVGINRKITLWNIEQNIRIRSFKGHAGKFVVTCIFLSHDGQRLISGSENIRVWNVRTGECEEILSGHTDTVSCVTSNTDGRYLASGSWDKTVRIWEMVKGQYVSKYLLTGHSGSVNSVSLSANGERLASGSGDKTVLIWEVNTGRREQTLLCPTPVTCVSLSPDGRRLVSSSDDTIIRMWNADTGQIERLLEGHTGRVCSIAFSADADQLASGSEDETIRIWEMTTGRCKQILKSHPSNYVTRISLAGNGKRLFSASSMSSDMTVRIWDLAARREPLISSQPSLELSISLSADEKQLASGMQDGTIQIRDVSTGQHLHSFVGHTHAVCCVSFNADGRYLASGSMDGAIRVWDMHMRRCIQIITDPSSALHTISLSADAKCLASGNHNGLLKIWNVFTGQCEYSLKGHDGYIATVTISNNGRRFISGGQDKIIRVWDASTGQCIRTLKGHTSVVDRISISANNQRLASGGRDSTLRIWDIASGNCIRVLNLDRDADVFFDAGGGYTASTSDGSMMFSLGGYMGQFPLRPPDSKTRIRGKLSNGPVCLPIKCNINSVFINNDGTFLASASGELVNVWDLATGISIASFSTGSEIRAISYHHPATIAVTCKVSSVQLWRLFPKTNQWYLFWSGHSRPIFLTDCQVDASASMTLSDANRSFMEQKGAHIDIEEKEVTEVNSQQTGKMNLPTRSATPVSFITQKGTPIFAATPIATQDQVLTGMYSMQQYPKIPVVENHSIQQSEQKSDKPEYYLSADELKRILQDPHNDDLLEFSREFYQLLAKASSMRETRQRGIQDRRLDAMARLLVGDEACAAISLHENHILIATNRNSHEAYNADVTINAIITIISMNPVILSVQPVAYVSFDGKPPIRALGESVLCDPIPGTDLLRPRRKELNITLNPSQHLIPYLPEVDINYQLTLTDSFPAPPPNTPRGFSKEVKTPFKFETKLDPLRRRIDTLFEHLSLIALVAQEKDNKELKDKALKVIEIYKGKVLMQSLAWEIARWFDINHELRAFKKAEGQNKKKDIDKFLERLNADFNQYKLDNNIESITTQFVKNWVEDLKKRIKTKSFHVPEFFGSMLTRILKQSLRYFTDLEKLENYLIEDVKSGGSLSKLFSQRDKKKIKDLPLIIDLLENGVHAEMRILWYFLKDNKLPPYIAISKLCCSHCGLVMNQLKIEAICGIHGKAYPGWRLSQEFRTDDFLKKFLGETLHRKLVNIKKSGEAVELKSSFILRYELALLIIESIAGLKKDEEVQGLGISDKSLWKESVNEYADESDDEDVKSDKEKLSISPALPQKQFEQSKKKTSAIPALISKAKVEKEAARVIYTFTHQGVAKNFLEGLIAEKICASSSDSSQVYHENLQENVFRIILTLNENVALENLLSTFSKNKEKQQITHPNKNDPSTSLTTRTESLNSVTDFFSAIYNSELNVLQRMLTQGFNINARDTSEYQATALHLAAREGNMDVVELLLNAGADPGSRDTAGNTPADWAERSGNEDIRRLLISKNSAKRPQVTSEEGTTTNQGATSERAKPIIDNSSTSYEKLMRGPLGALSKFDSENYPGIAEAILASRQDEAARETQRTIQQTYLELLHEKQNPKPKQAVTDQFEEGDIDADSNTSDAEADDEDTPRETSNSQAPNNVL